MNRKSLALIAVVALLIVTAMWWMRRSAPPLEKSTSENVRAAASTTAASPPSGELIAPPSKPAPPFSARLDQILDELRAARDPEASRRILAELRKLLDALPPSVASREAQSFLASQKDAVTKLDLTVKAGGALGDASSLRVFLLDYLGQIDRAAAANIGRQILSTPTSPDEWAVSLRNVAWADDTPDTRAYLRTKVGEMIANPAWRQNPSAGFLEAFDVIVHARGFDLTPQLTELVRDHDQRALAHAAYLTLDRLTLTDATATLTPLATQPELMEGREQTRANFFARLDVRDQPQKALLESYLLDPRRTPEELQTFAGIYPNANYMISNNLLTPTSTPDHAELAARDRATLQVVEGWVADPRFARLQPQLATMRERLRTFVQQAATPPTR